MTATPRQPTMSRARRTVLLALLGTTLGAALATAAETPPAPPANRFAATIVPAERFEVDGVLVERHGNAAAKARPMILIPGLASGSWAWQDTIRAFAPDRAVYVLTLPGFDGRPAAGPEPLAAARAAVERLIASRRLDRPIVVGHSLGGLLALQLAAERPQLVGAVVTVDGLPVMPGTEGIPPAERARVAQGMAARMTQVAGGGGFAAQQQVYMRTVGVLDMGKADDLAKLSSRSDPVSVGRYAADVLALDLRPDLKNIAAPVLVVVPYFDLDSDQQGQTQAVKVDYYRALMEGTPNLQLVPVAPARHFAMIDQPQAVIQAVRAFVDKL